MPGPQSVRFFLNSYADLEFRNRNGNLRRALLSSLGLYPGKQLSKGTGHDFR